MSYKLNKFLYVISNILTDIRESVDTGSIRLSRTTSHGISHRKMGFTVISRLFLQNLFCKSQQIYDFILITNSNVGLLNAGLRLALALLT